VRNTTLLTLLVLTVWLAGCQSTQSDTASLEDAILQTIIANGGLEEDLAIIAQIDEDETVVKVWRYESGQFEVVDAQLYYDAMGSDRSKWPPDTFRFSIISQSDDYAEVEVLNFYDMGISPDSRGGNGSTVTLQWSGQSWDPEWDTSSNWD
jgi:hypothetical protein